MTTPDLAGIIERDRQSVTWADFDAEVPQRVSDAVWQAAADRRALLGLLRETREALVFVLKATHPIGGSFSPMPVSNVEAVYDHVCPGINATAALAEP